MNRLLSLQALVGDEWAWAGGARGAGGVIRVVCCGGTVLWSIHVCVQIVYRLFTDLNADGIYVIG